MSSIPNDYDTDPARFGLPCYSAVGDTHEVVAERIAAESHAPVLDLGCGRGKLAKCLPEGWPWIGIDPSPMQLSHAPSPTVLGDGGRLPFASGVFGVVAALWCLYHFEDPRIPIAEAARVLRPGGWFVTCTNSRHDSPEIATGLDPTSFDAEDAGEIVASVFGGALGVERWDAPWVHLEDAGALANYIRGRLIPPDRVKPVVLPIDVTKRGVLVWAQKAR